MDLHVRVRAPATSANLGPAFDAAGLALDWWDSLEVQSAPTTSLQATGEQAELLPTGPDNLVRQAMGRLALAAGAELPPVHLSLVKGFPLGRGLGSSAAAVALGLLAARALVAPGLADAEVVSLAAELEGHPDNVAACLAGGATLSWREGGGRTLVAPAPVHPELACLVLVAPEPMATAEARRLLPDKVPFEHAASTAGRAALLSLALAGDFDLLLPATEDVIHQPARLERLPATARVVELLRGRGHAACLSGAGPSVLVLSARSTLEGARADAAEAIGREDGWRVEAPGIAAAGALASVEVTEAAAPAGTGGSGGAQP